MPLPDVRVEKVARSLLADPEQLDWYLRWRLLMLTAETASVAIKAIELLMGMEITGVDSELSGLGMTELEAYRARALDILASKDSGAGDAGYDD